jgi:hypothetical protein
MPPSSQYRNPEPTSEDCILAEVFRIPEGAVPPLFAYRVTLTQGDVNTVAGKTAYRMRSLLSGVWVWSSPWLLSDTEVGAEAIAAGLRKLWEQDAETFGAVTGIERKPSALIAAYHRAAFAARGLWDARGVGKRCKQELDKHQRSLGSVQLSRHLAVRPWEVIGEPALSLSVDSQIELSENAWIVARRRGANSLIGSWVADRFGALKGQIVKNTGSLGQNRERLLRYNPKEDIARIFREGDPAQPIYSVQVRTGLRAFEYPAEALRPVLTLAELKHYGVSASAAQKQLRLAPSDRANVIKTLAAIGRTSGLVGDAYATGRATNAGRTLTSRYSAPDVRFGDQSTVSIQGLNLVQALLRRGAFRKPKQCSTDTLR